MGLGTEGRGMELGTEGRGDGARHCMRGVGMGGLGTEGHRDGL